MEYYVLPDGSFVGMYNGQPFNFHPEATPVEWGWINSEIESGRATMVEPPTPPAPTEEELLQMAIAVENEWRSAETAVVKDNLDAILFEDPDALPGTADEWKAYGVQLRKWKEGSQGFPDKTKRPTRPA